MSISNLGHMVFQHVSDLTRVAWQLITGTMAVVTAFGSRDGGSYMVFLTYTRGSMSLLEITVGEFEFIMFWTIDIMSLSNSISC